MKVLCHLENKHIYDEFFATNFLRHAKIFKIFFTFINTPKIKQYKNFLIICPCSCVSVYIKNV